MFYIFDCNDKIVGNPKGYRTIRGAIREQDNKKGKAYAAIWRAFYHAKAENPNQSAISSIREKGASE